MSTTPKPCDIDDAALVSGGGHVDEVYRRKALICLLLICLVAAGFFIWLVWFSHSLGGGQPYQVVRHLTLLSKFALGLGE